MFSHNLEENALGVLSNFEVSLDALFKAQKIAAVPSPCMKITLHYQAWLRFNLSPGSRNGQGNPSFSRKKIVLCLEFQ